MVRLSAVYALGAFRSENAVPYLIEATRDRNASIRKSAVYALGRIQTAQAIPALLDTLKDENSYVRQKSADSLEKIVTQDDVDTLLSVLRKESDEYVLSVIVYLLGEIGGKDLASALKIFGDSGGQQLKDAILSAMSKLQ